MKFRRRIDGESTKMCPLGIKLTKRDFDLSLYILHVGTNDLALEDIPEAKFKRIIATAENLKKEHNKVVIYRRVGLI